MKKKSDYLLLFDNNNSIKNDEMNNLRGGSICGNMYVGTYIPVYVGCTTLYIGIGSEQ